MTDDPPRQPRSGKQRKAPAPASDRRRPPLLPARDMSDQKNDTVTIRSATANDETALVALWRACNLVTSYNDPAHDFRFSRGKENSDVLVAVDEGRIIGSVMVGHDGHRGWMYYVAAHPENRKQGIGKRMSDAAEQWLQNRGVVKVLLLIRETNTAVVDFYTHLGFELIPHVIMQRWLKPPSLGG
jgi:ribosomal protein S18 acetylase RimI-like enzyme